jgi:hypothetical protein
MCTRTYKPAEKCCESNLFLNTNCFCAEPTLKLVSAFQNQIRCPVRHGLHGCLDVTGCRGGDNRRVCKSTRQHHMLAVRHNTTADTISHPTERIFLHSNQTSLTYNAQRQHAPHPQFLVDHRQTVQLPVPTVPNTVVHKIVVRIVGAF